MCVNVTAFEDSKAIFELCHQGHFISTRNNNTAQQSLYCDLGTTCFKNTGLFSDFVK